MWPKLSGIGEIAPEGNGHYVGHKCFYRVMRKGVKLFKNEMSWPERCQCGRCKQVDHKFFVEGSKSPKRTIRWYDAEGNLERVTGDTEHKDPQDSK